VDNPIAQHFAERMGFQRDGVRNGLVEYGMAA
jgi:RimJ/RimL family protein N-acetyltransferase